MRAFLLFITLIVQAWGSTYDPFLLETQLSLLPKITLLEKNVIASNKKAPLKILIAYDDGDSETAVLCVKILNKKFNGTLGGKPLQVTALPADKIGSATSYNLLYALKMPSKLLDKIRSLTDGNTTVTALYEAPKLLNDGYLFSILLERNPIILVNAKALKQTSLSFPDHLLEMARIIE